MSQLVTAAAADGLPANLHAELKALANYLASVEGDLQVVPQSRFR